MKISRLLNALAVSSIVLAVARIPGITRRQITTTCSSCPSDVTVTHTTLDTTIVTSSATVSTDAGGVEVTADARTDTTTIETTTTVEADSVVSTTTTIGGTTFHTMGAPSTVTSTVTQSSTVTTCLVTRYKMKRDEHPSEVSTSIPSTTSFTTNFGAGTTQYSCVCRLVSTYAFPSSTSTSPADTCSCPPVQTLTITSSSTITGSTVQTTTISHYETSTITPRTTATVYDSVTVTTTSTTTITISKPRVTITDRSTITTTTTVTPTYNSCPTPQTTCNNQGVRWAIYKNTDSSGNNNTNKDKTYSSFDPTVFKLRSPMFQNVTYTLGGFRYPSAQPVYVGFYNSTQKFWSDYIAINHVGYVFAQISGTYTWSINSSDDITLLWVGTTAITGWTRANANIVNPYGSGTSTYKVTFTAGQYYPFRIVYGNGQEAVTFYASLTAPDGTVILNSNSRASPYLVQFACDPTLAPAFPPFGSET